MSRVLKIWYNVGIMPRSKDKPKDSPVKSHGKADGNLTIKEQKFVKGVVAHGNATQAVVDAGYNVKNRAVAGAVASKYLQKDKIQTAISAELDKAGLTDTRFTELLEEAIVSGVGRDSRNSDALRGLDMLAKLKDYYPEKSSKVRHENISLSFSDKSDPEIKELLKAKLRQSQQFINDVV